MEFTPEIKNKRKKRIKEIEQYVQDYFKMNNVGNNSIGQSTQGTKLAGTFWGHLDDKWMKPIKDILEQKLTGKNLIDLGTGSDPYNLPWRLDISINKYISVDVDPVTSNTEDPKDSNKFVVHEIQNMIDNGIDASVVKEDLLIFTTHLPDKSSNFFLSAIDSDVILDEKYWKYLIEEIYRATEDRGIVIEEMSDIESYFNEDKDKWKCIFDDKVLGGKKIFEKI